MGVSGCGKSTLGRSLAVALDCRYVEGDELHPAANVAKMAAGTPLTDDDRAGWLAAIAALLAEADSGGRSLVVSCSALKRSYRDRLRAGCADLRFVHLQGDRALLLARMDDRPGHYMPASLLDSQLATLEPPGADEQPIVLDIALPPAEQLAAALSQLRSAPDAARPPMTTPTFTQVELFTDQDGRARFRTHPIALDQGKPEARLSALMPSAGCQLRHSPVGFRSDFHCSTDPQWVFILSGRMEIGLQDGSARVFDPGEHFHSADLLPPGATFDAALHGHRSRQVGDEPLITLFVRS